MRLDRNEERQQHRCCCKPRDHERIAPTRQAATGYREYEAGEADEKRDGAEGIEPSLAVATPHLMEHKGGPDRAGDAQRDVEPEHPLPRDGHECPTEHRPENK